MIVKKTIRMLGIAMMLASCSKEDVPQETNESDKNVVTFTATLDKNMNTRADDPDNNANITRAIVEVYSDDAATQKVSERVEVRKGTDGKFTFSIPNLNAGQEYTFLFWADDPIDNQFDVSDLKNVKQNNQHITSVAYSLATRLTPEQISQLGVQLKHAVAKISMTTTGALTTSDRLRLHYPCYKTFNVLTSSATGTSAIDYYEICNAYSAGDMICTAYVFGTEATQTLSIESVGRPIKEELTNVPMNPNKHIILKGNYARIGLYDAMFTVSLDANWGSDETRDF